MAHVIVITLKANDSALSDCDRPSTNRHSPPFIFPSFIHLRPLSLVSPPLPSPLSLPFFHSVSLPLHFHSALLLILPFSTSHSFLPLLFLHLFLSLSLLPLSPSQQACNTTHFLTRGENKPLTSELTKPSFAKEMKCKKKQGPRLLLLLLLLPLC